MIELENANAKTCMQVNDARIDKLRNSEILVSLRSGSKKWF